MNNRVFITIEFIDDAGESDSTRCVIIDSAMAAAVECRTPDTGVMLWPRDLKIVAAIVAAVREQKDSFPPSKMIGKKKGGAS